MRRSPFSTPALRFILGPAPIVGNPVGREALVAELAFEFVPYTPKSS
jgi:hypothetical protein